MKKLLATALGAASVLAVTQAAAQVTLWEWEGMRGAWFIADRPIGNLDHYGFNDRASSAVVQRGQWEICEHAGFTGRCAVLGPGQYPSLGAIGLGNQITSIRPLKGKAAKGYAPPPPVAQPYAYYPKQGERLYEAPVVAVRAVMGPPEQRCWVERQYVPGGPSVPGAIVGGILGGVLGHQIGNGSGNDVATALGAVTGAAVGANVGRGPAYAQNVQRCAAVPGSGQVAYWDVTYSFRGRYHRAQLSFPPGATIAVNSRGEPRG